MIRHGLVLAALLVLVACQPPAEIMSQQKKVALVLDMDKAAPALSAEQLKAVESVYHDALQAELGSQAQVLDGPAPDENTPEVLVEIDTLAPPVLEKGLFKAWIKDAAMDVVVNPLLASKGLSTDDTDDDPMMRAIHRSVDKHRLKQLNYRPFILVGSVSFFDKVHRYDEDLDGWKLLTLMRPILPAKEGKDQGLAIRKEEARALAQDVLARLKSRSNWGVSLRHPPEPPSWLR